MIATVTLNPSLDKTLEVENLQYDDTNRVKNVRLDPGGKGINVSRVIRELAGRTVTYGFLGGHNGQVVEKFLHDEGLQTDFNWVTEETRENIIISEREKGTQTKINTPGPFIHPEEIDRLKRKLACFEHRPHFLVFSGSIPPGAPTGIYRELIEVAKNKDLKTILDSDGAALLEGLRSKPYMLKPNLYELNRLVGRTLQTEEDILGAGRWLLDEGVELVVVSAGSKAAYAITREETWVATPPAIEAHSTVGAGDSMVAAMALKLSENAPLEEALRYGVAAGTAAVITVGTELVYARDVENFFPQVKVRRVG